MNAKCTVGIASVNDCVGISKLLNEWFDKDRVKTNTSPEWIRSTFLENHAIWVVAKDSGGTVRACISSFKIAAPYPNSLLKCGQMPPWGIVDWFCVHPLWRGKGVATNILETLDFITYKVGRKAHIFLKEGIPLPFPQIPVYSTILKCRRAGSDTVIRMREGTGLGIYDYHCIERDTGLPMVRVDGLNTEQDLDAWEKALDNELPPCWIFVNGSSIVDASRGWKSDSLVSMYAFRWIPGKWLFKKPHDDII
jgi:GNAT superfamily N-acetyltransferase